VRVTDKHPFWGTQRLAGLSDRLETGEWKCVDDDDLVSFDLGTDRSLTVRSCIVYHRSREASERHCRALARKQARVQ
jgi:hypothetical protein